MGKLGQAVSQTSKFAHDIAKGTTVVTYDPEARIYHIGRVTGDCMPVSDIDGITYKRNVEWERETSRDLLATSSRNSLGSLTTIFSISPEVAADLNHAAGAPTSSTAPDEPVSDADDDEARFATYDDGIERIKDRALSLGWDEMEQLVAGLLRSMGYHAEATPKGPDGGRDVVASPDPLGLESPRIIAEVKHRKAPWALRRSAPLSAAFAPATAGSTCPQAASPRKPATRPTAPTCRCGCSTSTGS